MNHNGGDATNDYFLSLFKMFNDKNFNNYAITQKFAGYLTYRPDNFIARLYALLML